MMQIAKAEPVDVRWFEDWNYRCEPVGCVANIHADGWVTAFALIEPARYGNEIYDEASDT